MKAVLALLLLVSSAPAQRRAFDVASVKVLDQDWLERRPTRTPGRIVWKTDLFYLIGYAYGLQPARITVHVPGDSAIYSLEATFAPGADEAAVREMLQTLLEERFQMQSHREKKEIEGYVLSVAKGGVRMADEEVAAVKDFKDGQAAVRFVPDSGLLEMVARKVTAAQIAASFERTLSAPVEDRTRLEGTYTFSFRWADQNSDAAAEAPYLMQALPQELGLTLDQRKISVETLIVDSIVRTPTEN
jgi:uncharacterized protein (TIGR03435 family)